MYSATWISELIKAETPQLPKQPASKMNKLEVLKLDKDEQLGRAEAENKDPHISVPHQTVALHQVLYVPFQCPDTSDTPPIYTKMGGELITKEAKPREPVEKAASQSTAKNQAVPADTAKNKAADGDTGENAAPTDNAKKILTINRQEGQSWRRLTWP